LLLQYLGLRKNDPKGRESSATLRLQEKEKFAPNWDKPYNIIDPP